ncbi:peptidyl-prolyl cis-trans isomerase D [Azospirillaceae bacterium]
MLQLIRGTVGTWVVKILFLFLIASFAIWGIGDIFRSHGTADTVAEVGPLKIRIADVDQEFRKEVNRLRRMFGGALDADQARQMGLMDQALEQLIERALFDQAARDAGLEAGDDLVKRRIQQIPAFRNAQGQFEAELLRRALASNSLTEPAFIQMIRGETGRELLVGAIAAGALPPKALSESLYRHREEKRIAETLTIADSVMPEPPTPDAAEQTQYHEDKTVRFTAPEYRSLSLIALTVDGFGKTLEITEDEVKASFDQRADEFQTAEQRSFQQVVVDGQDKAQKIADAARAAADDLAVAAKAEGVTVDSLDAVTAADLPELGSAVFAIDPNTVSEPLKSALGWHVIKVTKLVPATTRKFAEVHDEVAADLRRERAGDGISRFANRVDDALAGGATLEEVTARFAIPLIRLDAVDSAGLRPDGSAVDGIPDLAQILQTAFSLAQGGRSPMTELADNSWFTVRVDSLTPSHLRPLEEVRDQVIAGWKAEQRAKAAAAKADEILAQLKAGATVEAVAKANTLPAATTEPLTRDGRAAGKVPAALVATLFTLAPGEAAKAAGGDGQIVARLKEIQPADPAAAGEALTTLGEQLRQGVAADIIGQYTTALRARYRVRIDETRLKQLSAAN